MAFKYDITSLIELVESKPCLWDKTHDDYKNKLIRDNAWEEISEILEESYDYLNEEEKKKTVQIIIQKWSNIRDAFSRSLRTLSTGTSKRKYVYYEYLQFLLKSSENANSSHSDKAIKVEESRSSVEEETSNQKYAEKTFRKRQKIDTVEAQVLKRLETEEKTDKNLPESNTFFTSFIPYISDMTESEKLQLHMDILASISKIKQKRKIQ